MNGYQYEHACAAYLRKKGFRKVQVTQASRDRGADIIAFRKKEKCAVQCKYYQSPVGNKAVQEVYAAATFYGCDRAIVMTNSTFTRGAVELAESLQVELMPGVDFEKRRGLWKALFVLTLLLLIGSVYLLAARPEMPDWLSFLTKDGGKIPDGIVMTAAGVFALLCLFSVFRLSRPVALTERVADNVKADEESPEEETPESEAPASEPFDPEAYSVLYDLVNIAERSYHETEDPDEREAIYETLESAYAVLIGHEEELPEEWESPSRRWEELRKEE
ncbi:MAG: restriction endonuclease [Lachnospiraceae bacterium]|nr:restriction endonuclease [Lachnospiraceae bacterium]